MVLERGQFFLSFRQSSPISGIGPRRATYFVIWRVPNPPGANPLVAERAFPASDYWGRTGVARCAEEMTQESVGISNRLLTACHTSTQDCEDLKGPFSYQGVSTRGVRHSPGNFSAFFGISGPEASPGRLMVRERKNT